MRSIRRLLCGWCGGLLAADALFLFIQRTIHVGVLLPFLFGAGLLLLAWRWDAVHSAIAATPLRTRLWRWAWIAFWLWMASVAVFWIALARTGSAAGGEAASAIVVLGSGTPGGKASPVLAARLDVALQRAQAQPAAFVVVSGGLGFGETRSEAEVMADYLRAKGLAPARIVQEAASTSTDENLRFSRSLLERAGVHPARDRIEIVTSDFHTMRSGWIARHAGYANVRLVAAPTPLYARYNAWLREYFAAIAGWLLGDF